ncbi:glycerate kinase [Granulicoccus sp. GXG6511]|uniref:glycerate kinase n=1 Tax=Granulicoccus sp. GXG6511 TaxID=3381351 RepID=UPI003D7E8458
MRVLVATDQIGALSSAEAGRAIAAGWLQAQPGAQLAVAPLGEAGSGFARAIADQLQTDLELISEPDGRVISRLCTPEIAAVAAEPVEADSAARGLDPTASSVTIGLALAEVLRLQPVRRVFVDLKGVHCHDAGAGILGALGARGDRPLTEGYAALSGITDLDLGPVRDLIGDTELVAVVGSEEVEQHLLGLRGVTSLRGREVNADPADMLAADAALERLAALANPEASALPGAGAAGGAAYAIAALGGTIVTGPAACAELVGLSETINVAELVVTGSSSFDFGSRGGSVMQFVAEQAQRAMRPCIALAGTVVIGSREMRTMGVESAYPVYPPVTPDSMSDRPSGRDVTAEALTEATARIARTWSW